MRCSINGMSLLMIDHEFLHVLSECFGKSYSLGGVPSGFQGSSTRLQVDRHLTWLDMGTQGWAYLSVSRGHGGSAGGAHVVVDSEESR